jgi:hypothetical protein
VSVSRPSLPKHWQDKAIVGLSLLLAASTLLPVYEGAGAAAGDAVIVAALMAAGALALLLFRPYWPDFFTAFFGFWLTMSPRILGFSDHLFPTMLDYGIGGAVIVLGLWSAVQRARELTAVRAA